MKTRAVVALSGGLDSAVALAMSRNQYDIQRAYFVKYGQKAWRAELRCAQQIALLEGTPLRLLRIGTLDSPLTNQATPPGAQSSDLGIDPNTVMPLYVPMRNLILYAHIASHAYGHKLFTLVTGNTPSTSYPDTGRDYLDKVAKILRLSSGVRWNIIAPLIELPKVSIVQLGQKLGVPFQMTWSCLLASDYPCGQCRSCLKRAEAFRLAGLEDPGLEEAQ